MTDEALEWWCDHLRKCVITMLIAAVSIGLIGLCTFIWIKL